MLGGARAAPIVVSLNHLICAQENRARDREAEHLGSLEVDNEVERGGLLDRQRGGLRALEDLVHVGGRAPLQLKSVRTINHETAGLHVLPQAIYRWQATLHRKLSDLSYLIRENGVRENHQPARLLPGHRRESAVDLLGNPRLQSLKPQRQGPSGNLRLSQLRCTSWIGRIPEDGHARELGNYLLEH